MNDIRPPLLGGDIKASSPAVILQRFRWPAEASAYCSAEFARWDVGQAALVTTDESLILAPGDQVDFTTLANAIDHKKCAALGRLSHVVLRIAGQGRAKLILLDVTATGAARIVTEQVVELAATPTEMDLGDPATLAGNRLALLIHAETAVRLVDAAWISESTDSTNGVVWPEESAAGWKLQRFVWPDASRSDRVSLYAKWPEGPARLGDSEGLPLPPRELEVEARLRRLEGEGLFAAPPTGTGAIGTLGGLTPEQFAVRAIRAVARAALQKLRLRSA